MRLALFTLWVVGCAGAGSADHPLDRRGFPGEGSAPPGPRCDAPGCWASDSVSRFSEGIAPDAAGGVTALVGQEGRFNLLHIDDSGTQDRSESLATGSVVSLSGTADGGFLLVSDMEALGETPTDDRMVLKADGEWNVEWTVHLPRRSARVYGSRVDGGGLIHSYNGGPGGTSDQLDLLTRYDASGNVSWELAAPNLAAVDLADNDDVVAVLGYGYYLTSPESVVPAAPAGATLVGAVVRWAPDGSVRFATGVSTGDDSTLNHRPQAVLATDDGGAWVGSRFYAGGVGGEPVVYFGDVDGEIPTMGSGVSGSPLVRLDASGTLTSMDWPWTPSPGPASFTGPHQTTEIYDFAPAPDGGAYVAGIVMVYDIDPPSTVLPYDGGLTTVAGRTMGQSGAYLAEVDANGDAAWALGHWVDTQSGSGHLVTDGAHLFYDAFGDQLERGDPAGSGSLLRLPLE